MNCCVLQISCIQVPCVMQNTSVLQFQPWMWIILTRTHLVLLSISNVPGEYSGGSNVPGVASTGDLLLHS